MRLRTAVKAARPPQDVDNRAYKRPSAVLETQRFAEYETGRDSTLQDD